MRLVTKGFKSRDHDVRVDGLTLLLGRNGEGKSSLADSLRFLALGYIPQLGKRPQDVAPLMRDRELTVELRQPEQDGATGNTIKRSLTKSEKTVAMGATVSWMSEAKATEAGKAIQQLFGREEADIAEVLDIRQLLNATPNQRAQRLEELTTVGASSPEEIVDAVARYTVQRLLEVSDDKMPMDYKLAIPMLAERHAPLMADAYPMLEEKVRTLGVAGALTWANEEKKLAAEGLKRKEAAAKELRTRAAEVEEPDAKEVEDLKRKVGVLQKQVGVAEEQQRAAERNAKLHQELNDRLDHLRGLSLAIKTDMEENQPGRIQQLADTEKQIKALMDEQKKLTSPRACDRTEIDKERKAILGLRQEAETLVKEGNAIPIVNTATAQGALRDAEKALTEAKANPWSKVAAVANKLDDLDTGKSKAIKEGIEEAVKTLNGLANAHGPKPVEDLRHEVDRAKAELARLEKASEEAAAKFKKIDQRRLALGDEAKKREAALTRREQDLREQDGQNIRTYNDTVRGLADQRMVLEKKAKDLQREIEKRLQQGNATAQERKIVEDQLDSIGGVDSGSAVNADAERKRLQEVQDRLDTLTAAGAVHAEIQRAMAAIENAKAGREVYQAIEMALQRYREQELAGTKNPLLDLMGQFLKAAGRVEIPFIKAGATFGWTRKDGREVLVQALSGGEWALFAAGLTLAVLLLRKADMSFLLVEAGELDDVALGQLQRGIGAFASQLTGAIVMIPRTSAPLVEGWRSVDLSAD